MNPDYGHGRDGQTHADMLAKMELGWPGPTPCGNGSSLEAAAATVATLALVISAYGVHTLANVGAGDLFWWPRGVDASHYDLVPRHPDVATFDATIQVLPPADLILCRFVLNHLSVDRARRVLTNFRVSGSKYLLLTTSRNQTMYWQDHQLTLPEALYTTADYHPWRLNLYRLSEVLPCPAP